MLKVGLKESHYIDRTKSIYTKTTLNRYKRGRWDTEAGELSDFESIPLDALIVNLGYFLKQPI